MPDEEARAVQEIAKTSRKALELAERAGPFLDRVFGTLVENAVGVVSDRLAHYRLRQFYRLVDRTNEELGKRGVQEIRPVPPSLAIPLLEAAALEEKQSLHDLWANLLATAMDPKAAQIQRSFIAILKELEPIDAALLMQLHNKEMAPDPSPLWWIGDYALGSTLGHLAGLMERSAEEVEISLWNLERVNCIYFRIDRHSNDPSRQHVDLAVTPLGKAFLRACRKDQK